MLLVIQASNLADYRAGLWFILLPPKPCTRGCFLVIFIKKTLLVRAPPTLLSSKFGGTMLQIRMISGGEMSIPLHGIHNVRGLKRHLNQLRGFPLGFRQRLLLNSESLEDAVKLDSPMDLDIVLLQYVDAWEEQVNDLLQAADEGSLAEIESRQRLPQDPNLRRHSDGATALRMASEAGHVGVVSLLDAGADKDVADNNGITALIAIAHSATSSQPSLWHVL